MATAGMASDAGLDVQRGEKADPISRDQVVGTSVYRPNGDKIGRIENVIDGKGDGNFAYAVLSFSAFPGLGEYYYPFPWSLLTYTENLDGYELNITEELLRGAPKCSKNQDLHAFIAVQRTAFASRRRVVLERSRS